MKLVVVHVTFLGLLDLDLRLPRQA